MEDDLASDGGINVESDVLGCGEIEMKSDKTIVKPPLSGWPVFMVPLLCYQRYRLLC
ncbi:hypothetical protein Bca52824_011639 [Brassica carinata]|uniref:Uncharacterized protein n=1 Tax=Brassica carinata TaxID=52824 RepID=A0A8X7VVH5_BRACI|nr:hypothetical protein Bca52824_011639 [Brassica carinata]